MNTPKVDFKKSCVNQIIGGLFLDSELEEIFIWSLNQAPEWEFQTRLPLPSQAHYCW